MANVTNNELANKIKNREQHKKEVVHDNNDVIKDISDKPKKMKDMPISARVNSNTYNKFKKICNARGISVNSCLNMIITDYVRENKNILEEE